MQQLRILALVILGVISLSTPVLAQEKLDKLYAETTPQERAERQTANMQNKLNLREDQRSHVYDINFTYAQKMEATYKAGGSKMQRLRNMKAVATEKDAELKNVLDAGQYEIYQKYKEEMKEELKERAQEK